MSTINQTRFFKILTEPESNKLKLPASFIRKCGQNVPDKVTLKAPNGSVRQGNLVHTNGETWFHKGWKEFKDFYSIGFGHLLVFEYNENSHFDVLIFDTSTVEIEYPIDIAITDDEQENCRDLKGKVRKERLDVIRDRKRSITYQKAKYFESNNPFFISLMRPSYVTTKFCFAIPAAFAKENLTKECTEIMLHIANEGTWNVKCLFRMRHACLSGGWGKFAKDNNLKEGDFCVFEVIKKLLWNVIIYRS